MIDAILKKIFNTQSRPPERPNVRSLNAFSFSKFVTPQFKHYL